nr:hypothetical protein CFP56_53571 [Quercus suber]
MCLRRLIASVWGTAQWRDGDAVRCWHLQETTPGSVIPSRQQLQTRNIAPMSSVAQLAILATIRRTQVTVSSHSVQEREKESTQFRCCTRPSKSK